jgi:uncharacterized damage-inducible protein DinB
MFIRMTLQLLDTELEKIQTALDRISDEEVWKKLREGTNSIGNLCLHLAGNEQHNIISSIGGRPFSRERSAEFLAEGGLPCSELAARLHEVREKSREVLTALTEEDLSRDVLIVYPQSAGIASSTKKIMELMYHVTTHYGYHTGQIVYMARLIQQQNEHLLKWRH